MTLGATKIVEKRRYNPSMLLSSSVYNFYVVKIINILNTYLTKIFNSGKTGAMKVKSYEGSEILPDLQTNKLACHGCWQKA